MTIMDKEEQNTKKRKRQKSNLSQGKDKLKKKVPIWRYRVLSFIMIILTIIMIGVVVYNEVFNFIYLIPFILILAVVMFVITFLICKTKLKVWIKNIISIFAILIIVGDILMIFFGTSTLKFLSSITDTGYRVETYGVYVLGDSKYKKIEDLDDKNIAYLSSMDDDNVIEVLEKIDKDIDFEDEGIKGIDELLEVLLDKSTDAIVFEMSYEELISDEYEDEYKKIKLIDSYDIVDTIDVLKSEVDLTEEPFIVYISGIDTIGNVTNKARSDVNLLVAIHPKTQNIMIVNTPRDYYIELHTNGKNDKFTHTGLYGIEESVYSLENLYDVDINYYVRANFTSVLKMIDALGGIEVDVPIKFCEQNSLRSFSKNDLICLNKGKQILNGEEALALARHRKSLATGDRARGKNQMLVLEAMINKALSPSIITNYSKLIKALQGRVVTNITTDEMYFGARELMENTSGWKFTKVSAKGKDATKKCYSTGVNSSVMEPDLVHVESIKNALNNLIEGKEDIELEERVSGSDSY